MVRAVMMTKEQMNDLVEIARADHELWAQLKDREINYRHEDASPKIPSLSMLVEEFVQRQYGADHNYDVGSLIMLLRSHTRRELGLPV